MAKSKTYELMLKIGGKADNSLKGACAAADKNLAALGNTAKSVGKTIAGAALAGAAVVGTLGVAAVKAGAEYETQLANISTLLTGTEAEIAARTSEIGNQILDVSNRTGVATANLTDGMYQVISAFGDSTDAANQLEIAAKAAAAGNATTTDAINLLSAVTKGYGDTSAEAVQKAADLSFATVRLGQTSFPELAASMGKVVAMSSTMKVSQEEVFGAMATLTGVTGNTAEVATQLQGVIKGFLQPSDAMQKALKKMGYSSGQAMLEANGLQGSLNLLKESVNGNDVAFSAFFGDVTAKTAVLSLAGSQAENFTSKTAEMYTAVGATDAAFQKQTNTMQYTIQEIKNLGANFLTQLGTNVLPYVKELAEAALPVVQEGLEKAGAYVVDTIIPAAKEAVAWVQDNSDVLLALAGAVGAAIAAYKIGKGVITAYNTVQSLFKILSIASTGAQAGQTAATVAQTAATAGAIGPTTALAVATNALCWPLLAVVAAIAAVVAVVILLVRNWDKVKATAIAVWGKIKAVWSAVAGWFNNTVIQPMVNFFSPIVETIGGFFRGCWIIIQAVWKAVSTWFNDNVIQPLVGFFSPIVETIGGFFSGLWDNIVSVWSAVGAWFQENVAAPINAAFQAVSDFVKGIVNGLLGSVEGMINGVINAINSFIGGFSGIVEKAAAFIGIEWGGIPEIPTVTLPRLAVGGIATGPTIAEIGEGGEPEAVLPLSKLADLLSRWNPKPKPGGGGGTGDGVTFAPVFNFYGGAPTREEAMEAGRLSFAEFKRLYDRMRAEERRKSFSPA